MTEKGLTESKSPPNAAFASLARRIAEGFVVPSSNG